MSSEIVEKVHDGKAEKKNKKRKGKKSSAPSETQSKSISHQDMLIILKEQLAEAKINKDHKRAGELRNQIWVLTDIAAGVKTSIPEDELDKIIESIHTTFHPPPATPSPPQTLPASTLNAPSNNPAAPGRSSESLIAGLPEDKRMKTLRKKLEQIEGLKERQSKGEKLEANQLEKINGETKIHEEIKEIQEILAASMASVKL